MNLSNYFLWVKSHGGEGCYIVSLEHDFQKFRCQWWGETLNSTVTTVFSSDSNFALLFSLSMVILTQNWKYVYLIGVNQSNARICCIYIRGVHFILQKKHGTEIWRIFSVKKGGETSIFQTIFDRSFIFYRRTYACNFFVGGIRTIFEKLP